MVRQLVCGMVWEIVQRLLGDVLETDTPTSVHKITDLDDVSDNI